MRKEERSELIHDALNFLDEEMIEDVEELRGNVGVAKNITEPKKGATSRVLAWKKWAVLAASVCLILGINYVWNDANVESNEYNDMNESHDKPESMESNKEENKEENKENITDSEDYNYEIEDGNNIIDNESSNVTGILSGYKEIYFGNRLLSGEDLELIEKFMETYEQGSICDIELSTDMEGNADGHLYFKFEDGSIKHLVLLGNGLVYNYETSDLIQMDTRIYKIVVEILREES